MQHEWEVTEPDAEMQIRKWQRPSSVSHCFSVPGSFPEGPPVGNKKGTESSSSGFSDYLLAARANRGLTQSKAISFGYYLIRGEWLTGHSPRWTWRKPFALIRWGGGRRTQPLTRFPHNEQAWFIRRGPRRWPPPLTSGTPRVTSDHPVCLSAVLSRQDSSDVTTSGFLNTAMYLYLFHSATSVFSWCPPALAQWEILRNSSDGQLN